MALTDIVFQEGEKQDFIVEVPTGTLSSPVDILMESGSTQYPVVETTQPISAGNIFIMSE